MTNVTYTVGSDRPLLDPRDDVLGYAPFAKQLARTLLRNSPADGFVIAIYGAWGTGKSTALNFVAHYMEQDPDADPPIIVRFNPWWFAGGDDLVRRFFAQFEGAVLAARAKKTKLKSSFEKFASAVAEVPFAPVQAAGKVAAAAARAVQTTDLFKLKEELSSELAKEPRRIVVIMDDIDRLVTDEIRQLFRLIKAVADFPNVTYLLAFDREVASRALNEVHGARGDAYLEKIVQAPFELPAPDRTQLRSLLTDRLAKIIGEIPDGEFDQVYWGNVFMDGIDPFVVKPRDIVRLVNALTVTYPAIKGEVNIVDFVALETLRVFSPVAYDVVRSNPEQFLSSVADRWGIEDTRAALRTYHDTWLETLGKDRPRVQALLTRLFPRLESLWAKGWGTSVYDDASALAWRRAKRVCAQEYFSIYFRLSLPHGAISSAEFDAALANDRAAGFASTLRRLASEKRSDGSTRASVMLDRLNDYARHEKTDAGTRAPMILQALFDIGDHLIAQSVQRGFLEVDDEMRLQWLIRNLVKRIPHNQRLHILKGVIERSGALGTVIREVVRFGLDVGLYGGTPTPPEEQLLDKGEIAELEQRAKSRLVAAAADGTLWEVPKLLVVLSAWQRLGDEGQAIRWLHHQTSDDARLLRVLEQFVGLGFSHGMTDRVSRTHLRVSLKSVALFFEVETLVPRVRLLLAKPGWREQQVTAMRLIVEAYDRRAAGERDRFEDLD